MGQEAQNGGAAWVPFSVLTAVPGAAICRPLERKLLIFLKLGFFSEAEGRRFEPGLALHSFYTDVF